MSSIFPERVNPPQIFRTADIAEVLRARWVQLQTEELEKGNPKQVSKLWQDHFRSVADFHVHLLRIGGLERYTSVMERIRRFYRLPTIRCSGTALVWDGRHGGLTHQPGRTRQKAQEPPRAGGAPEVTGALGSRSTASWRSLTYIWWKGPESNRHPHG